MSPYQFEGTSALALDGKGRINVPTRHREVLMTHANGQLTLSRHPDGCVMVCPRPVWEEFREKLMTLPWEATKWRRIFLGSAQPVEIDSAGRLLVAPELRASAGLMRDVLLMGMGTRLELWDAQRYAVHEAEILASEMPEAIKSFVF
ncbi:MAG: division/cell wall cluster transcriptional repressor MraZ [Aquabacterium sp.]|nr:division/cell wall cluster transcriptional repressor MraZ [Aquabacterium sp.]